MLDNLIIANRERKEEEERRLKEEEENTKTGQTVPAPSTTIPTR
jgi:hypothetical protein